MKKILIVEDEATMREALVEIFSDEGFQVVSAMDGELGVEMAGKEMPDVILLDLILPKKDGLDVLKEVKENEKTKNIPVFLLTNLSGADDIQKALDLGATTYLVKSEYQLADIVEKVKEVVK